MGAPVEELSERLRADLAVALKARDRAATAALRVLLAALANAEAPARDLSGPAALPSATPDEHPRLALTAADVAAVLAAQVADREDTIVRLRAAGQDDAAADLEAELAVVRRYLPSP